MEEDRKLKRQIPRLLLLSDDNGDTDTRVRRRRLHLGVCRGESDGVVMEDGESGQ